MKKKIIEEFNVAGQPDRDVGIEIEMEGTNLQVKCVGWDVKEDGSLRGESAEFVLRKPVAEADAGKLLRRLQVALRENKARLHPSDRCGVHVHVNCQQMSVKQVVNFCLLYLIFEDLLVKWCGEDREGNLFCMRAQDAEFVVQALCGAVQAESFKNASKMQIRYASMNITSLAKYGSVEFRAMRSPDNFDHIETWVKMLMDIKRASLKYEEALHIIEDVSMRGPRDLLQSVFGENARQLYCPNMSDMLMDAVRRVQDIAHAHKYVIKKKELAPGEAPELPDFYWRELQRAKAYIREIRGAFAHWDPFIGRLSFTNRAGHPDTVRWSNHGGLARQWELGDPATFNYDHQADDALIERKVNEIQPVVDEWVEPEEGDDWFPEDEEE